MSQTTGNIQASRKSSSRRSMKRFSSRFSTRSDVSKSRSQKRSTSVINVLHVTSKDKTGLPHMYHDDDDDEDEVLQLVQPTDGTTFRIVSPDKDHPYRKARAQSREPELQLLDSLGNPRTLEEHPEKMKSRRSMKARASSFFKRSKKKKQNRQLLIELEKLDATSPASKSTVPLERSASVDSQELDQINTSSSPSNRVRNAAPPGKYEPRGRPGTPLFGRKNARQQKPQRPQPATNSNSNAFMPRSNNQFGNFEDADKASMNGSLTGSYTDGSMGSSVATEFLNIGPSSNLLSTMIPLTLMKNPSSKFQLPQAATEGLIRRADDMDRIPSATRTAITSLERHIQFHLSRPSKDGKGNLGVECFSGDWAGAQPYLDSDSFCSQLDGKTEADGTVSEKTIRGYLQGGNTSAAVIVYQNALQNILLSEEVATEKSSQRIDMLLKLAILLIHEDKPEQALERISEAFQLLVKDEALQESNPLQGIMIAMGFGLGHLACNRASKAVDFWKKTLETARKLFGSQHPLVGLLLNNMGVMHAENGDSMAAQKNFEASIALQKSMLKNAAIMDTDQALNEIAIATSNLATVCEFQDDLSSAVNHLQEAQAFFESVNHGDLDNDGAEDNGLDLSKVMAMSSSKKSYFRMNDIAQQHLERLLVAHNSQLDEKARSSKNKAGFDIGEGASDDASIKEDQVMASLVNQRSRKNPLKGHQKSMHLTDVYDYLLMGTIKKEWSPKERVREAVLAWFGLPSEKIVDDQSVFVSALLGPADGATTQVFLKHGGVEKAPIEQTATSVHDQISRARSRKTQSVLESQFEPVKNRILGLVHQGKTDDAIDVCRTTLNTYKASYIADHPMNGMALHMLGMLHLLNHDSITAFGLLTEAVRARKAAHGADDSKVASSLMKLALLQYSDMDIPAAGRILGELRNMYLSVLGYEHPHLAQLMNNIGVLRYEQGDVSAGIRALEIAYEYQRKSFEDAANDDQDSLDHKRATEVCMAYTLSNMAFMFYKKDDRLGSLRLFQEAKAHLAKHAPQNDRVMLLIKENVETLVGRGLNNAVCAPAECLTG